MDIGRLLHALVNVIYPDWLISSNFRLGVSVNLHTDSHQNSWISTSKKEFKKNMNVSQEV